MSQSHSNNQRQYINQKLGSAIDFNQSSQQHEHICLKEGSQHMQQDRISTYNQDILSRNNFKPEIIISLVLLFFVIIGSLDCVFRQQSLKEKEEFQVRKIIESQIAIRDQLKNVKKNVEDGLQDSNQQVQELFGKIQSLQSKVSQLKKQLQDQKIKQIKIIQSKANEKNSSVSRPKFRMRQNPRTNISQTSQKDLYQFPKSMNQMVHYSSMKVLYLHKNISQGIQRQTFERAIRLMQLTHNIDLEGNLVMDNFRFYFSPKQKYEVLAQLMDDEREYYDKKYEINKSRHQQIGMCIFVNSYNNAQNRLYLRNLDSIFQQNYQNYHLVYLDDASTDQSNNLVIQYMEDNQIPKSKYTIINNDKRLNFGANAYKAGNQYCQLGEVMVLMDGGDSFIGRQVLSLLNAVYQREKVALTYGSFLQVQNFKVTKGFSQQIRPQYLETGQVRQAHISFISPLKTMYVDIVRLIKETDLQHDNGTFYDIGSDIALMTSAIQLVGTRLKLLPELIYEHRSEARLDIEIERLRQVQNEVWKKQPSYKLVSMSFADYPIKVLYQ